MLNGYDMPCYSYAPDSYQFAEEMKRCGNIGVLFNTVTNKVELFINNSMQNIQDMCRIKEEKGNDVVLMTIDKYIQIRKDEVK